MMAVAYATLNLWHIFLYTDLPSGKSHIIINNKLLPEHDFPLYPTWHKHLKPLCVSKHVPPFAHVSGWHGLLSVDEIQGSIGIWVQLFTSTRYIWKYSSENV